jgi:hypothetical protein
MNFQELRLILTTIGERVPPASQITLIGGSALVLLGSSRLTMDIDFIGDDIRPNELHRQIIQIAKEFKIHVEPVPLERFIPLPEGHQRRAIPIGQFGNLSVSVADPYSIALSKLDRGLESDLSDLVFLIQHNYIKFGELESILKNALPLAAQYDFHPEILSHLENLKALLK